MAKLEIHGYKFENESDLHELLEADVITYDEYEELVAKLISNEPIKPERVNWKKKYLQEKEESDYWFRKYKELENFVLERNYNEKPRQVKPD